MNREKAFDMDPLRDDSAWQVEDPKSREMSPSAFQRRESSPGSSDMDVLVSEFLEELNVVSASLSTLGKANPEPAANLPLASESTEINPGVRPQATLRMAQQATPAEGELFCGDLDAELSWTLGELEARPKSNVIPLTIREPARPQQPTAPVQEWTCAPVSSPSETVSPISAAIPEFAEPEEKEQAIPQETPVARPPVPVTASDQALRTASSRNQVRMRRIAIAVAALVLLAVTAAGLYYFLSLKSGPAGAVVTSTPSSSAESPSPGIQTNAGAGTMETAQGKNSATLGPNPLGDPKLLEINTPIRRTSLPTPNQTPGIADQEPASRLSASPAPGNAASVQPTPARPATDRSGATDTRTTPGQAAETQTALTVQANPPATPLAPPPAATSAPGSTVKNNIDASLTTSQTTQQPQSQTAESKAVTDAAPIAASLLPAPTKPAAAEPPTLSITANENANATTAPPKDTSLPLVTIAEPLIRVAPSYPAAAGRMNVGGRVELTVEVDEHGNVVKAKAIKGPMALRAAAEDALKLWRFKPATLRGVNVKSEVNIFVDFKR